MTGLVAAKHSFHVIMTKIPRPVLAWVIPEQGASHEIVKGAGRRQIMILEQGAPKIIKRSIEQRKILQRSMEQ